MDVSLVGTPDGLQASTESVQSTVLQGRPDQVELMPVYQAEMTPDRIHQAEGGAAMIQTNEVWWQPFAHGAPLRFVAALNNPIINSRSVDVDADGLSDLLLWNRTEVALLRGHPQGGLAWGLGWETSAESQRGVGHSGDANGDSTMDVVMLISQNQDLSVIVLNGNGAEFTLTPEARHPRWRVLHLRRTAHERGGPRRPRLDTSGEIRAYALRDEVWGTVGEPLSLTVHPAAGWIQPAISPAMAWSSSSSWSPRWRAGPGGQLPELCSQRDAI